MPKSLRKPKRSSKRSTPWGWSASVTHWPPERIGYSGVFETLRCYRGTIFALEPHLERLRASARTIGLAFPQPRAACVRMLARMAHAWPHGDAVIRAMIVPSARGRTQLVVMGRAFTPYPARWYTRGVTVRTAVTQRFSPATIAPQAKHMDLAQGILAHREGDGRAVEYLYRIDGESVAEGTVSNLCVVTNDRTLVTPPPSTGTLAGVTCHTLFELAGRCGLATAWRPLTRHEVWNAAEAFLTNTTFEVLPIVNYDGRSIGTGRPGPWTQRLHAAFRAYAHEATSCRSSARS